jgi:hypothetical protein
MPQKTTREGGYVHVWFPVSIRPTPPWLLPLGRANRPAKASEASVPENPGTTNLIRTPTLYCPVRAKSRCIPCEPWCIPVRHVRQNIVDFSPLDNPATRNFYYDPNLLSTACGLSTGVCLHISILRLSAFTPSLPTIILYDSEAEFDAYDLLTRAICLAV